MNWIDWEQEDILTYPPVLKITDEKPNYSVSVLFTDNENVYLGYLIFNTKKRVPSNPQWYSDTIPIENVTHWMTSPYLPKHMVGFEYALVRKK